MLIGIGLLLGLAAVAAFLTIKQSSDPFNDPHAPGIPPDDSGVRMLISQKKMIAAIKLYREIHHTDLKEAKAAVDALEAGRTAAPAPAAAAPADDPVVADLVRAGQLLEAIKAYRELHGTDLKTAKDAVDALARTLKT